VIRFHFGLAVFEIQRHCTCAPLTTSVQPIAMKLLHSDGFLALSVEPAACLLFMDGLFSTAPRLATDLFVFIT